MKYFSKIIIFLLFQQAAGVSHHAFIKTPQEWSQMTECQNKLIKTMEKKGKEIPIPKVNKSTRADDSFKRTKILILTWGVLQIFF